MAFSTSIQMRTRVENEILEDIKKEQENIDQTVRDVIWKMEEQMVKNRSMKYNIGTYLFDVLPKSCRRHAMHAVMDQLVDLGYDVTFYADDDDIPYNMCVKCAPSSK